MCFPWPLLLIRVLLTTLLYCYFLYNFLVHPHVLYVVSYSSHIVHSPLKLHFSICTCCILFWSLAHFYVHIWIETENRIKLPSHNTGQISHQSASCLKNQSLAGFWMLHEKNRLKFSLRHYLSWWPLLTAIPKQLTKDPIFWLQNWSCSHS